VSCPVTSHPANKPPSYPIHSKQFGGKQCSCQSGVETGFSNCPACSIIITLNELLRFLQCNCRDLTLTFHVNISLSFVHVHLKFSVSSDLCKDSDSLSYTTEHTVYCTHALYLLLLLLTLQLTMGFSLLSDSLPFCSFFTLVSPPSYSHYLYIFFDIYNLSLLWSPSSSCTYRFPL
jgi:hypothetical protein